jgi:hypothetical protein
MTAPFEFSIKEFPTKDLENVTNICEWNVVTNADADRADQCVVIEQYLTLEQRQCPRKTSRDAFKYIDTALPRHCAIIAASRRQTLYRRSLASLHLQMLISPHTQEEIQSQARARVHTLRDVTPFTELSVRQTNFVLAHSGIAHLLSNRLAGGGGVHGGNNRDAVLKCVDIVSKFITSNLACQYLAAGNRYYRNLPLLLETEQHVVGGLDIPRYAKFSQNEVTPEKIEETRQALATLYADNADRLEACIAQYERGLVSLESVRTDPEFVKMFSEFWKLSFQTMTVRTISESRIRADYSLLPIFQLHSPAHFAIETAERILMCRAILETQCQFAGLFQYRIAHIFDNSSFNYASLVSSAKFAQMNLCNDGMVAALLTFAAIEPRMVTSKMVPNLGASYLACDLMAAANHVQSRDPVFGSLLAKHRNHIPRTNALRFPLFRAYSYSHSEAYKPIQETLNWLKCRHCSIATYIYLTTSRRAASRRG